MKVLRGSLWDPRLNNCVKVVPTNLGWKSNGENVMGRGVAKQATEKYQMLSSWYGWRCKAMADNELTRLYRYRDLVLFPVKSLDRLMPHMSWRQPASLELVEKSTIQLASFMGVDKVALPLVGCGNGGLDPCDVLPILQEHLRDDRFLLILTNTSYKELQL